MTQTRDPAQQVRDIMSTDPITCAAGDAVVAAASAMRDADVGDVIVLDDGRVSGILTDRDIVVRVIADGGDPTVVRVGDVCSAEPVSLSPEDPVTRAVSIMREYAVRRVPVVDGDRPVGIVSIGDLARERDPESALADISTAPPDS